MATRKKPAKAPATLASLLAKELIGETLPSEGDLALMMRGSVAVCLVQPWQVLRDSQVYAFDSEAGHRWYCLVMGGGGEVFAIQAHRGDAGFALYDDIQEDRLASPEEFVARQDIFIVEFVRRSELTPLDRAMLALSPEAVPSQFPVPQIRVSRPCELPWYPNAEDVAEVNDCLMASLLFFEWQARHPKIDPWAAKGKLPLLKNWATKLTVEPVRYPPRPAVQPASPTKLDERRVNQLLASVPKRELGHPVEADVFLMRRTPMRDGGRPYYPWVALGCDSSSGFLFPMTMGGPGRKREDVLVDCVLGALEASPFRPVEYWVRDEFCRGALEPLAQAFEIPLKVKALAAIAEARAALEAQMGH